MSTDTRAEVVPISDFNPAPNSFFTDQEPSFKQRFLESLPPGNPALSLNQSISEKQLEAMSKMHKNSPLDYFRVLSWLPPTDRVKVLEHTDFDVLAVSVATTSENSYQIAQAAQSALGEENTRSLALSFTERPISRTHQLAAIVLVAGLPLRDVTAVFAQYANLARSNTEEFNVDFSVLRFLNVGLSTLAYSLERDLLDHPEAEGSPQASEAVMERARILELIIDQDLYPFFRRIDEETTMEIREGEYLLDLAAINSIRKHMAGHMLEIPPGSPSGIIFDNPLDMIMGSVGYTWISRKEKYLSKAEIAAYQEKHKVK